MFWNRTSSSQPCVSHAVHLDEAAGLKRVVVGAMGGPPLVFEGVDADDDRIEGNFNAAAAELDGLDRHMQRVAIRRALAMARE